MDAPLIFEDPLAMRILGPEYAEEALRAPDKRRRPFSAAMRAFLVARSRYAEDQLAQAYRGGVRQYCLLGAGLDTFAYRTTLPGLQTFEVDHPATQAWKQKMLAASGLPIPDTMRFVPVDFERQQLRTELEKVGFDFHQPCFFAWLGVVPYLTIEAFRGTLAMIAAMPPESGVTFDYGLPRASLPLLEQLAHDSLAARVAAAGEPFRLFFTPQEVRAEFHAFRMIEDLDTADIFSRYFSGRDDGFGLLGSAAHLLTAWL